MIESTAVWQGVEVKVRADEQCVGHKLEVIHHEDGQSRHYCPTGFLWCPFCAGVAHEPGLPACTRWGE